MNCREIQTTVRCSSAPIAGAIRNARAADKALRQCSSAGAGNVYKTEIKIFIVAYLNI
jgi:hypothetical protein